MRAQLLLGVAALAACHSTGASRARNVAATDAGAPATGVRDTVEDGGLRLDEN